MGNVAQLVERKNNNKMHLVKDTYSKDKIYYDEDLCVTGSIPVISLYLNTTK